MVKQPILKKLKSIPTTNFEIDSTSEVIAALETMISLNQEFADSS